MGAFLANFHVRSEQPGAVRAAVSEISGGKFRLSGPHHGWISIYEQRASTQDDQWIRRIAQSLSFRLETSCIAFMVHDSDIACYWLCDRGDLLDEYNSYPDYFDPVSQDEVRRLRGKSDVLLRYCRPGVTREQLDAVLQTPVTFTEDVVCQLAEFLGIDPALATEDFHDGPSGDDGPGPSGGDSDGDRPGGPAASLLNPAGQEQLRSALQQHFARVMGSAGESRVSPQGDALVAAAASGNVEEIDQLVQRGADVDGLGVMIVEPPSGTSLGPAMPGIPIPPLIAAASAGQTEAAGRLIELGADPLRVHPLLGSALHAAVQRGYPETAKALIAAGVPIDIKNLQGQTPLELLQATFNQIAALKSMIQTMPQLQGMYEHLVKRMGGTALPQAGWKACEELLRQQGA